MEQLFLSYDVETTGPIPSTYSMISIGVVGFDSKGDVVFEYTANLQPLNDNMHPDTNKFWLGQQEAWKNSTKDSRPPKEVMNEFSERMVELKKKYTILPIAKPACFDWQFLNYYMHTFCESNILGYQSYDMGSYAWAVLKDSNPACKKWSTELSHTPLEDARKQGEAFMKYYIENTTLTPLKFHFRNISLPL